VWKDAHVGDYAFQQPERQRLPEQEQQRSVVYLLLGDSSLEAKSPSGDFMKGYRAF
jgi:hypothetical protein